MPNNAFLVLSQWELVYHDDFEDILSLEGWSSSDTYSCGSYITILGGHCNLSYLEVFSFYELKEL